jgi:hypothetical protein
LRGVARIAQADDRVLSAAWRRALIGAALALLPACTIRADSAADDLARGGRAETGRYAFIYYANETAPLEGAGPNARTLLDWLGRMQSKSAAEALDMIKSDMASFPGTVAAETAAIEAGAARSLGVAIITNAGIRDGRYLAKLPGSSDFTPVAAGHDLRSADPRLESNPLDDRRVLRDVLLDAVSRTAADGRPVVLVVKSHGNEAFALMPRSFVDMSRTSFDAVRAYIAQIDTAGTVPNPPPPWLTPFGVRKSDFMATLEDIAEARDIRFRAVFLEACKGGVGLYGITNAPDDDNPHPYEPWRLPPRVETFVSGGPELMEYANIDYARLFRRADDAGDFLDGFLSEARADGLTIQQHDDYSRYLVLLWFAPLAAWLVTIAVLAARRRLLAL